MPKKLFVLMVLLTATPAAYAESFTDQGGHLVAYAGLFDALDDDSYGLGGLEYRWADVGYGLHPTVGAFANEESDAYLYAGINWDLPLTERWIVTPGFSAGAYHHGAGKDLGGVLEFKSGIETSYRFDGGYRVGVQLNHLSNASLYDSNPGEENLVATVHIPMMW